VACQYNYIGINPAAVSRSGIFVSDLPGVEDLQYDLLSKDSETLDEVWERISRNSWTNLVSDVEAYLQEKFWVNTKLISSDTSKFKDELNVSANLAGIRIQFDLSRYSKIHIVSVEVWSDQDYTSPDVVFGFYEDTEDGELLHEVSAELTIGRNIIFVDKDFEVDKVFVSYDPSLVALRQTKNRIFNTGYWNDVYCRFPCFDGSGSIQQVNGGGINLVYNVYCSSEKFVCQNINLFKKTLWWRYGVELANERRIGNRLNQFTTLTQERKTELADFYGANYQQSLSNSLKAQNIYEDWICFECKGVVGVKTVLP
jgi:hypothetical protein